MQSVQPALRFARPLARSSPNAALGNPGMDERDTESGDRHHVPLAHRRQVVAERLEALPFKQRVPCRPPEMSGEIDREIVAGRYKLHFLQHQVAVSGDGVVVDTAADERPRDPGGHTVATQSHPEIPIADAA